MKIRIVGEPVAVHAEMDADSKVIKKLAVGDEVSMGPVKMMGREKWVQIFLPDERSGYIPGDTHIFPIRVANITQKSVDVKKSADVNAETAFTLEKGTGIEIVAVEKVDPGYFYLIRLPDKRSGYIGSKTGIKIVDLNQKKTARITMLVGAVFAIIGAVLMYIANSSATPNQTFRFVAMVVLVFGLYEIVWNGIRYFTAPKGEKK